MCLSAVVLPGTARTSEVVEGSPIRVLFLGHESEHHNSNRYFPMLAQALGRDAIYFDYETDVSRALDRDWLFQFDALVLYANHTEIAPEELQNLNDFVESGHGFLPIHCASACFPRESVFVRLVGGAFLRHGAEVFQTKIVDPDHPAMLGVSEFSAWDETYVHSDHNQEGRRILMVREGPNGEREPWTWVRDQGAGRVFYTASGHDQRVWELPEFHQLIKSGLLWAVGDEVAQRHATYLESRTPLEYETVDFIPNYENRPEPLPLQGPLSPEDSLSYTRAPMGYQLELFAAEPDIVNPIAMTWDERGRLWVAESVDYPNEIRSADDGGRDRIKILEDTDGDGRADKSTIFADGFNIPTSLVFAGGGLIVAHAPDMLILKDTDGDDRADSREVLFSGWGKGDTHAGPSNLRYGLDNWVYGTVGYSGFRGSVGGVDHRFGQGVYRFRPDGSQLEFLHQFNNNTWGLGFNNAGDVFGSTANNNPSFFGGIPETIIADGVPANSARMIADSPRFHPITPNIRQVDAFGAYTAGCGHALATSDGFPSGDRDQLAFVCGPTGHLLGGYRILPDGAGYSAKNAFAFVASADEWFSPVAAEVGPDGSLWIADWYNFIIQHNPTPSARRGGFQGQTGPGNAHVNPNRDREHGRIYRAVWNGTKPATVGSLGGAEPLQWVAALESPNQFWRLAAQRLLVAANATEMAHRLRQRVTHPGIGAVHAFWALEGLGELDGESHAAALLSTEPALRRNAIRALGTDEEAMALFFDSGVVTDPDLTTRLAAINQLSRFPTDETIKLVVRRMSADPENRNDDWLQAALSNAAQIHGIVQEYSLGENIAPNPSFEDGDDTPEGWERRHYSGRATASWDDSVAHTGSRSLRIESDGGADSSWFSNLRVEPGKRYRLSAWVKTQGLRGAMGALLNIHGTSPDGEVTAAVSGDSDWTEIELIFDSGSRRSISVNTLFGGWGWARGVAWWDDIQLAEVVYSETKEELEAPNAERGQTIFATHPVAACIRCHQLNGEGGIVGPALDGIGAKKTADYLRESLVDPSATMAEGFDLPVSPMPPMGVLLEAQELEDLLAFLTSLQ